MHLLFLYLKFSLHLDQKVSLHQVAESSAIYTHCPRIEKKLAFILSNVKEGHFNNLLYKTGASI